MDKLASIFGADLAEGLREEQQKTIQRLEQMKVNLMKDPSQPGYEEKLGFCEMALADAKKALICE